jgi:hypothetical protein
MRRRYAVLLALALGTLVACASPSLAAPTYTQYGCHLPDGSAAPTDGFVLAVQGGGSAVDNCSTGGGFELHLPDGGGSTGPGAAWTYSPPPSTAVARISYVRSARNIGADGQSSARHYGGPTPKDSSVPEDACGVCPATPEAEEIDSPAAPVRFLASCLSTPCSGPDPGEGVVTIDHIAVTLEDDTPPSITGTPAGSLLAGGTISGTRDITFSAHDDGGGVYQAWLVVDGTERVRATVDANGGLCAPPFVAAVPCKLDASGSLSLDTTTLTDGQHDVSLYVSDATGTNQTQFGPFPIRVRNAAAADGPPSAAGPAGTTQGSSTGSTPAAKLVLARASTDHPLHVRLGRTARLFGQLVDGDGRPVVGGQVAVLDRSAHRIATATSDPNGRFVVTFKPTTSQLLTVHYLVASAATVRVLVRAPLTLAPSRRHLRNGQLLGLTARLHAPASGQQASVAFQVLIGRAWRTFAVRPLSPSGIATARHRFRVTYTHLSYRFRAVLVPRRGFPFARSWSAATVVTVN